MTPTRVVICQADSADLEDQRVRLQGCSPGTDLCTMDRSVVDSSALAYDNAAPGFLPSMHMGPAQSHLDFPNTQPPHTLWSYPQASFRMEHEGNRDIEPSCNQAAGQELAKLCQQSWESWTAGREADYRESYHSYDSCNPPVSCLERNLDSPAGHWNTDRHNPLDIASRPYGNLSPAFDSASQSLRSAFLHNDIEGSLKSSALAFNISDFPHDDQTIGRFGPSQIPYT